MGRSFPLRPGFFATPQVTEADERELLAWGRHLVTDLAEDPPQVDWRTIVENPSLSVLEDRQKGGLSYSIRATSIVTSPLDDVLDLFFTTSTPEFRTAMQLQLRDLFADAQVLFHREVNESESLGIKWVAMRSKKNPFAPVQQHVDFCLLEYTGVVGADILPNGDPSQPIGVCLYESIDQMECPPLLDSHKIDRGALSRCGFLFIPRQDATGNQFIEARFIATIRQPPNKSARRRLNRALLQNWAQSIGFVEESLHRRRISRELTERKVPNWVEDSERQCCHLCMRAFSNTRRRHHCRACGEIICRQCSLHKEVDLPSVGPTNLRVCKACMDGTTVEKETQEKAKEEEAKQKQLEASSSSIVQSTVEEHALALPGQQVHVPDVVGIAWLQQMAAKDPSKRNMVQEMLDRLTREQEPAHRTTNIGDANEQVDIYDTLCDLAAQTLQCKFAVVSLVDENRQWFKSAVNIRESDVPRDFSFCEYPVRDERPLVVMDTNKDSRFRDNPFVTGPLQVRFLAGAPLFTIDNKCVGAVCVLDTEPRNNLQEHQVATMQNLAHLAMVMVQERRDQGKWALGNGDASGQLVSSAKHMETISKASTTSSDMVPLTTAPSDKDEDDPALKQQMMDLLYKASQVRDQVNLQSTQQAGLQSSAE